MRIRHVFLFGMMIFFAGCATVSRPLPSSGPELTLSGVCRKYNIDCRWDGVSQTVTMNYEGKKIQALVGSNIVVVGGDRVVLSDALGRHHGTITVPADFERLVIGPAAQPQDDIQKGLYARRLKYVVVDAGHGGKDPGAIGYGGLREEDVTLDIARRVAKGFEAAGVKVLMTRDTEGFITLADRTQVASCADTDLFVSIHANAHKNHSSRGVEVYYAAPLNKDDRQEDQRRVNEKKLVGQLKIRENSSDVRGIVEDMLYAYKLSVAPGLAEAVARGIERDVGCPARGSKPQRFFVLRNTLIPAILVEVGFITNPREAALLRQKDYHQKLAEAITKSVLRYFYDAGM